MPYTHTKRMKIAFSCILNKKGGRTILGTSTLIGSGEEM